MRILISNDNPFAHYYIRLGIANAFTQLGHTVKMWNLGQEPATDVFDGFRPDLFISQTYNMSRTIQNAIKERPHMKVIMKAGEWSEHADNLDKDKFPVLCATEEEAERIIKLREITGQPEYLYVHYHPDFVNKTHERWIENGVPVKSQLSAADVPTYCNSQKMGAFESEITFIGGYWPYKARVLNEYLLPICRNDKYKIKIFGNQPWPVNCYCGRLDGKYVPNALFSATICPNLHEPHSQELGYDVIERPFKLLSNKCFVISDRVEGLEKLFNNDEMVFADSPEDFIKKINHYLLYPEERERYIKRGFDNVMENHTYLNRVVEIMSRLGFDGDASHGNELRKKIVESLK